MQITINTAEPLSDTDLAVLALLTGSTPVAAGKPATKKAAAAPAKPAEEPEDLLGGGSEPTMADAVALATKLVSEGEAAKVKEALAAVGAKRVSELTDDNIATFVNSLSE